MTTTLMRTAEFPLPGHPDKLADTIADQLVHEARRRDPRARVGVAVAIHRNTVFIDGRIACPNSCRIGLRGAVARVLVTDGAIAPTRAAKGKLNLIADLRRERLTDVERASRDSADDQSIVTGYACSLPGTRGVPLEHAFARSFARRLHDGRVARQHPLGPDGKVIVHIEERDAGRRFRVTDASVSIQHQRSWDPVAARRTVAQALRTTIDEFALSVPGFDGSSEPTLAVNGVADFVLAGSHGDNGLTGKKLVSDFYGPRVPIGGGALSGKDFLSVDRAGALIARAVAVAAVDRLGSRECTVTLAISPGDREFRIVRVEADNAIPVDVARLHTLVDLRIAATEDWPERNGFADPSAPPGIPDLSRWGHFGRERSTARPPAPLPTPQQVISLTDSVTEITCSGSAYSSSSGVSP